MAVIRQANRETPIRRDGNRSYPRDLYKTRVDLDVGTVREVDGIALSLHSSFHSPAYFYDDISVYSSAQEIQVQRHNAVLFSQLWLTGIDENVFSQSDAIHRLQKHISALRGFGGLWICPHLPLASQFFCQLIPVLVENNDAVEFTCATCRAQMKVEMFDICDINIFIYINKDLGMFVELRQTMNPHNNKHLKQYLSMRLVRGLQS